MRPRPEGRVIIRGATVAVAVTDEHRWARQRTSTRRLFPLRAQLIWRAVCQVGVFGRARLAGVLGGREAGTPGSVSALPV